MNCSRCQHENEPGAKFCEECAAALARICANCGRKLSPTAKFCPECAHPTGLATAPPATQRFGSPDAYTPKHLAERILTSKTALEGERKQVTVLFADMKGSMELLADRDPEEARRILDPVLEHMMEAVHRYEGTVNQVMGDGIMALFGAPLAHEDHAVRACYAALRMQETIKRYAEGMRRAEGIPIRIRVGLNSGEVVVRAIGSDLHMDYTAVGQTTHLAARMEQMADPGSVLMTAATLDLAEGFVQAQSQGPVSVKGLQAPVETFLLTGVNPVRSRLQAAAARGLTAFVGREPELAQLHAALEQAKVSHGQVVAVVGEPGVGKSRLFWELSHSPRTEGCLVLEAMSVSYGKATPYLPVIGLLRSYFQIETRDDPRKIREKVSGKLVTLDQALMPTLFAFLSLLDVPIDDQNWHQLESAQRRRRTLDGLKALVLRESQVQPLVVVFEDLHWIDGETQSALNALVDALPTARVLVLVNYRPEYGHSWSSKSYYRQIRLDPLGAVGGDQLLTNLVGSDPSLDSLKQLLLDRTDGNPFFLEESVRTLAETDVLVGERGGYRLTQPISTLTVPASVETILTARLDRLTPHDKRVLQTAAVIGKDVPLHLLQIVAEEPEEPLRGSLGRLQAAEFLYETRLFPDVEYTFKHALTYEVAYKTLLHDRRRDLHRRVLAALQRGESDASEIVERLSYHAEQSESWSEAAHYARLAGEKAFSRSAFREAVRHFEQAVRGIDRVPEGRQRDEMAIDGRNRLRLSLWQVGRFDDALIRLREAESIARELHDVRRLRAITVALFNLFWTTGRADDWRPLLAEVQKVTETEEDPLLRAVATVQFAQGCFNNGDYRTERLALESRLTFADQAPTRGSSGNFAVTFRANLAAARAMLGDLAEAEQIGREALRIAEAAGAPFSHIYAVLWLAVVLGWRGDFASAVAPLERATHLAEEYELAVMIPPSHVLLGWVYSWLGRHDEGVALAEQGLAEAEASWAVQYVVDWVVRVAEANLLAGSVVRARELVDRALVLAHDRGEPGTAAYARLVSAQITSGRDPESLEKRLADWHSAIQLASERGMRPIIARSHLGLGQLQRHMGKLHEAREHLTTAVMMLREMGMRYWIDQAEREVTELG